MPIKVGFREVSSKPESRSAVEVPSSSAASLEPLHISPEVAIPLILRGWHGGSSARAQAHVMLRELTTAIKWEAVVFHYSLCACGRMEECRTLQLFTAFCSYCFPIDAYSYSQQCIIEENMRFYTHKLPDQVIQLLQLALASKFRIYSLTKQENLT